MNLTPDYFRWLYTAFTQSFHQDKAVERAITVEERKQALMSADSTFHAIAEAAPDSYLGNFWRARANSALDPETTQGLAKPFYEEVAALLESKNDPHYNSALVECYSYLGYYYLLAIEPYSAAAADPLSTEIDSISSALKLANPSPDCPAPVY